MIVDKWQLYEFSFLVSLFELVVVAPWMLKRVVQLGVLLTENLQNLIWLGRGK